MTTKQAADIIRMLLGYLKGEIEPPKQKTIEEARAFEQQGYECLEMAIKALETVSCIKEKCAYCPHCENCDVDDETLEIKALEEKPCNDWYDVPSDEMTLEQARQAVKDLRKKLAEYLEQQPCEDEVSRDCDKCAYYVDGANDEACDGCFADEYEHPNFKPKAQHYEDCISRQAVDELSKELVHTTRDKADFLCNFWEGLQKLPPVTPKEKAEGYIHIDDVYRLIAGHSNYHGDSILSALTCIAEGKNVTKPITPLDKEDCSFEKMPSVIPKEKTGRWISFGIQGEIDGQIIKAFVCSECGAISVFRMADGEIVNGDLCPNCGAKMQEVENDIN